MKEDRWMDGQGDRQTDREVREGGEGGIERKRIKQTYRAHIELPTLRKRIGQGDKYTIGRQETGSERRVTHKLY